MADPTLFESARAVNYRPVDGYPGYRIGDDGSLWTCWAYNGHQARRLSEQWRRMKPSPDGDGYLAANLFRGGKPTRHKVHLMVLTAFIGRRPEGLVGCHNNGIVSDCAIENLRWDTQASNMQDRFAHGTHLRGDRNPNSKLNPERVRQIRESLSAGEKICNLAVKFGVGSTTIGNIKRGKVWSWV